jgi:small subunit ribosomal protein S9
MATKIYATGRRKASIAKVWLTPGSGKITINGLSLDAWLGGLEAKKLRVKQPLVLTKQDANVDIVATTLGWFWWSGRCTSSRYFSCTSCF